MSDTTISNITELNKRTYDSLAPEFEAKIPSRSEKDQGIVRMLTRHTGSKPQVLDIGVGNGNLAYFLNKAGCQVKGVEISPKMAAVATKRCPPLDLAVGDFLTESFTFTFDGITAIAFVHLYPPAYTRQVLRKIHSLLAPGGVALISTTKHRQSSRGLMPKVNFKQPLVRYRRKFTRPELETLLLSEKFHVLEYSETVDDEEEGKTWMSFVLSV